MKIITIGRSTENNIVVNDALVSRTHLQLVQNDNGVCSVVDLNSVNGTFVNGQKITGEVYLQLNDVIRIGNTTLPWQEYIKQSIATDQKPMGGIYSTKKSNKIWLYIAASVVFVLLAGGIGFYCYYNAKEREKIAHEKQNQEKIKKEQQRQEAEQKAAEAMRLQNEADELLRKALKSQNVEIKALAEAKQKEANEAKKRAEELKKAEADNEQLRKENEAYVREIANERAGRQALDSIATAAKNDAISAVKERENAVKERDNAIKERELIQKFYNLINQKGYKANDVLKKLNRDCTKNKEDFVIEIFNKGDLSYKQRVVAAIEGTLGVEKESEKNSSVSSSIKEQEKIPLEEGSTVTEGDE